MGFSKKHKVEGGKDLEGGKKWMIGRKGNIRSPLKTVATPTKPKEDPEEHDEGVRSTTPTGRESRIPDILRCPAAPMKPRAVVSNVNLNGTTSIREYFNPPDLESLFVPR